MLLASSAVAEPPRARKFVPPRKSPLSNTVLQLTVRHVSVLCWLCCVQATLGDDEGYDLDALKQREAEEDGESSSTESTTSAKAKVQKPEPDFVGEICAICSDKASEVCPPVFACVHLTPHREELQYRN